MLFTVILLYFSAIRTSVSAAAGGGDGDEVIDEPRQNIFCEGERANFSCPEGRHIALQIANYGRFSLGTCNADGIADWSTTCQNDRTLEILQQKCNGRTSCDFWVNDQLFGDPCPNTKKYLELRFECAQTVVTTTTSTTLAVTSTTTTLSTANTEKISEIGTALSSTVGVGEKFCESVEKRNILWPRTKAGYPAKVPCPFTLNGQAEWYCESNGNWSVEGHDLSKCTSTWTATLQNELITGSKDVDLLETLSEVHKMTKKEDLYGGDLVVLSSVINATVSQPIRSVKSTKYLELVVESVNNMAREFQTPAWTDLKQKDRLTVADSLMSSIDKIGGAVAASLEAEKTERCTTLSIGAEISNVKVHDYVKFPSMGLYDTSYDSVDVPKEALVAPTDSKVNARVVYVTYKGMSQHTLLKPQPYKSGSTGRVLASNITSISVIDETGKVRAVDRLRQPLVITFVMKYQANLTAPVCVWWDKRKLKWSEDGCRVGNSNRTHTVCLCSHMTHFAVLMNIRGEEFSPRDEFLLTVITYAGCTLSIVCLFFSIVAFQCFGKDGGDRIFIHKNLCLSLMVAEAVFLFGIWQTQSKVHCSIIAGVLHYSFLSALIWMLLEGIELYRMLVEVFPVSSKKLYLFLTGYGVPAVVVGISFWVDYSSYGTTNYCWLKPGSYCFLFAFTAPVSAIIFFNFAFLVMTLRIVGRCRNSPIRYKCRDERTTLNDVGKWVKGATALIFLLGITWTFGFFWIDGQNMLLAYLFTICNTLQGFFIFMYHVVFNDRMQEDIREWVRHSSWMPSCVRGSSLRAHPAPYIAGTRVPYGLSSNSSTGSELLYPSLTIEKYPQRMVASIDPRYNASVQMTCPRHDVQQSNGVYDYATIPYDSLCSQPFLQNTYFHQIRQCPLRSTSIYNSEGPHYRPPPNFPPPPPPPAPGATGHASSVRPHSSTLTKVSDDSAYSDGSSTFQYPNETSSSSGMLLRMDLTRNPPVFVQGL